MKRTVWLIFPCFWALVILIGCGDPNTQVPPGLTVDTASDPLVDADTNILLGVGEVCTDNEDCDVSGVPSCQTSDGPGCVDICGRDTGAVTCIEAPVCGGASLTCQVPGVNGPFAKGASCVANQMCQALLACAHDGTCTEAGQTGTVDVNGDCVEDEDCAFGLSCLGGTCIGTQFVPVASDGVTCELPKADDSFVAYFDASRSSGEFYRLPFPNDALIKGGKMDLSGHPRPGALIPELGDPVDTYLKYMERNLDGFGTNETVFFRFSKSPDWNTVKLMESVYLLNIDPDSPGYGEMAWTGFNGNTGRNTYICYNWIGLRPSFGIPLAPATTYAAIVTKAVTDRDGNPVMTQSDFDAMLSSSPPSSNKLTSAWNAYAPLRTYIETNTQTGDGLPVVVSAEQVAVAAVFTTQSSFDLIPRLREAVRNEALPQIDGAISETLGDGFKLLTGAVQVPFYQQGDRPFAEAGGEIKLDGQGRPVRVEDEAVEFALSIPDGIAPDQGWPLVIFAHGTGGSEQSFVENGTAKLMASKGVAVLSLLQVQHGSRRGLSDEDGALPENDPGMLFYNFKNPDAAVGNNLQAAAELFTQVRFAASFAAITGRTELFDTSKLFFFGHSQGTQGSLIGAIHEPMITGIILSGAGGYLTESLLNKRRPVDVASMARILLNEPTLSSTHPVLNIIQAAMELVDPINHRRAVYRNEWPGQDYPHRDVFMSFGLDDTYAPEKTQAALVKAFWLDVDEVSGHEIPGSIPVISSYPHAGSHVYNSVPVLTAAVQVEPAAGQDGHFVMFEDAGTSAQLAHFVETMVDDSLAAELIDPNSI